MDAQKINENFHIRSKVWIENDTGKVVFGLGRFRILSAIEKCGSINAAAKELHMSYRGIWGKIKTTEEVLGIPLLNRQTGGSAGGGSKLTPMAKELLKQFRSIQKKVNKQADKHFENQFSSLLK